MATPRSEAARRARRRRRNPWPLILPLGVVALLALGYYGYEWWRTSHVTVAFAGPSVQGAQATKLELTFFPDQLAFAAPSPPQAIGELTLPELNAEGTTSITLGRDLVPDRARVRYRAEGFGTGLAYVQLGAELPEISLRKPQSLSGRVGEPVGFWSFGWRCAGYRAIANAHVLLMCGGEHGVPLAEAMTDADGNFTLVGFDGELDALALRVTAPGYELAHHRVDELSGHANERALVALSRVPPRRGRLDLQVDVDPGTLLVLARGLPGVQARPEADGSFVLDHVPAGVEARILVHGLPDHCAVRDIRTAREGVAIVDVLPGAVVSGHVRNHLGEPMPKALVWTEGRVPTRTDQAGRYELRGVLPGTVVVSAQYKGKKRRSPRLLGDRQLELEAGTRRADVDIQLNRQAR
ncbi:MAG: carboxypeptidase-like regulatory domain-containing protein [Planctomycetota bacterium]